MAAMTTTSPAGQSRKTIHVGFTVIALLLIIFLVDLPLIAMVGTSVKTEETVLTTNSLFPALGQWSVENYVGVLTRTIFGRNIINSVIMSLSATAICVAFSAPAGFALSRCSGPVFRFYAALILVIQMFPLMMMLIPTFVMFSRMGLANNLVTVILYNAQKNLAFNILMIRSFFASIPRELDEAAKIDGAGNFGSFARVILPSALPGIATIAIITFLNCWNEYTFSSLLLRKPEIQTFTVGLQNFVQEQSANWGHLNAASAIGFAPAFIFLIFAQRYLVEGMTAGAVKG